ncbi:MAG: PAS domain-containing protein, partial [Myxococcota bacterium]|nr:PAS domain-containing protein [Myxococcota bacterium]
MWSDPVLDLLPNALIEVNPLGDVTQANASACALLGAGEPLAGRNLFEALHRQVPEDELLTDTGRGPHRIDIEGRSFSVHVVHHTERTVVVLNEEIESVDGIGSLNEEGLDQVVRVLGRLVS